MQKNAHPSTLLPLLTGLFLTGHSFCAQAADWPRWRGVDFDDLSKETGLLKEWPEGGPKKVWSNTEAGLGYSGFSIVKGTLFTMGLKDDTESLIAMDAGTGKTKWSVPVGPIYVNNWGDGPRGTPTVDGDRVYAMSGQGHLICASVTDGKKIWSASMKDFGGKLPGWGYTESVLVDEDRVVCLPGGAQGTLLALNKMTGDKLWQSTEWTDGAQYSSVIAVNHNGVRQYIALTMQNVGGVDAKTGKKLWLSAWPGKTAVIPTPIFHGGDVFVASGYGVGCKQVNVGPENAVADRWTNTNMVNHHGGVILKDGYLYGYSDKGGWSCLDWKTGEVKWAEKKLGKGAIHGADGMFYLLDESSGTVALIEASPDGWKEHSRFKIDPQTTLRKPAGRIWTHPVVSNGMLYLRDQELIHCYDVRAGR
jgi:outer membrane protein assembly factor BamB